MSTDGGRECPPLPSEIVEKILGMVLGSACKASDFFRLRQVCKQWRDCADDILVSFEKRRQGSPVVPMTLVNQSLRVSEDFFSDFAYPDAELVPESVQRNLCQRFWLNLLALNSKGISARSHEAIENLLGVHVAAISSRFVIASDSTGLALFDLRNEMSLVDSFPTTEENESIENMRVVYDVQNGREFLVCLQRDRDLAILDISKPEKLRFLKSFKDSPLPVENLSPHLKYKELYSSVTFQEVKSVHRYGVVIRETVQKRTKAVPSVKTKEIPVQEEAMEKSDLKFTWILEEKEKKTPDQELEIERQYRRMWFFENGRVVLTTDEDWQELVVTVNTVTEGPELQRMVDSEKGLYKPLVTFKGGVISAALLTCNTLILGTDNGLVVGYHGGPGLSNLTDLNLSKPDFRYKDRTAQPVLSISANKLTEGTIHILVHHPDRLQLIKKELPMLLRR